MTNLQDSLPRPTYPRKAAVIARFYYKLQRLNCTRGLFNPHKQSAHTTIVKNHRTFKRLITITCYSKNTMYCYKYTVSLLTNNILAEKQMNIACNLENYKENMLTSSN